MTPPPIPPTNPKASPDRLERGLREVAAVAMVLAGSLALVGLVFISNDPSPRSEHLLFALGLPGMGLVSAFAQVLVFAGLGILWTILRRRR